MDGWMIEVDEEQRSGWMGWVWIEGREKTRKKNGGQKKNFFFVLCSCKIGKKIFDFLMNFLIQFYSIL